MESQSKPGFNVAQGQGASPQPQGYTARSTVSSPMRLAGYILRVVAVVLTFISAIVMGVAKQTVTDPGDSSNTATVKSTYSSAFVYFIVINVIAFLYSSITLALSIANRARSSNLELPFAVGDMLMALLLLSCNSASAAISVVAEQGQSKLYWDKICDVVGTFCAHVTASIVLSMFASLAYVLLTLFAVVGFYKRV